MKTIFSLTLLVIVVSVSNLACKKTDRPTGLTSDTNESATSATGTPQMTAENKEQMVKELTAVLQQYSAALDRGDKVTLDRLLANDFNTRWQGKDYDKDGWIEPQTGVPNVATHEVFNAELAGYSGDTATLHFERRYTYKDGTRPYKVRDSATLVKRDGRWQIKTLIPGH